MICSSCHQETTLVRVGSSDYCRRCQARQTGTPTPAATAPASRSMDIRPQKRATAATSLHSRTTTPGGHRVLDLRQAANSHDHTESAHPHSLAEARTAAIANQPAVVPVHESAASAPKITAHRDKVAHHQERYERAKEISRSQHIAKFGHHLSASTPEPASTTAAEATEVATASALPANPATEPFARFEDRFADHFAPSHEPAAQPETELPAHVATHHEAMRRLAPAPHATANTHSNGNAPWRNLSGPRTSQVMAVAAIVAIMGGYIWLQNYPKLAIKSASQQAGIQASLPGYVPSSYSLDNTDTKPGLITFSFKSPSQGEALTIAQKRTAWDSSSLLDNYIAKQAANYSAVEGQGLTIYLYGQNQAAWINHGVLYQISGAGRLSRDQVLKIAYSL